MQRYFIKTVVAILICCNAFAQSKLSSDSIAGHKKVFDKTGEVAAWYKPEIPGAAYAHVAKLASEFIKNTPPVDPKTGMPLYYLTCCFSGPHMVGEEEFAKGQAPTDWLNNPACIYAGMVHSLVNGYMVYSGDMSYVSIVRKMLDYQIENGTTPATWPWASVPYASADPGETVYRGSVRWAKDNMRGEGLHGIEPDKVGELGYAYLRFYEVTLEDKYLAAAIQCADALAANVRDVVPRGSTTEEFSIGKSPWPFRVNAQTDVVISDYCSNVIEPIKLFDELLRLQKRLNLAEQKVAAYSKARTIAWDWLYSKAGPIATGIWSGYFEDIPNDHGLANRNQVSPMETARYLIRNPNLDPNIKKTVPYLLNFVSTAFRTDGLKAIKEQTWCYEPMGSHTARYASVCALWYDFTKDPYWKKEAYDFFNVATYMTDANGVVRVGPTWAGSWFSDGYGDYIRHFLEGLYAVPEWVTDGDRLLGSSSVIQSVQYSATQVSYKTFDNTSAEKLKMQAKPKAVTINGKKIAEQKNRVAEGWYWEKLATGGVLSIQHTTGNNIVIVK
ncbi:MAG: hypothetical protein BroJett042_27870 [Bacteroidota bacterium]|nr:MAG: hypothetical protein BroJett042_27870 [Bacteroidota bacterium]HNR73701.1 hypothetical protein [Cyclobacteriaceae bacterium]